MFQVLLPALGYIMASGFVEFAFADLHAAHRGHPAAARIRGPPSSSPSLSLFLICQALRVSSLDQYIYFLSFS
ncbi:hypothetical protein F4802DRAFT_590910 [Xylaria palmicola]|nr:hypothetical protein F4802DRAFT_590910 [Xylaria palmicola]